jgi:predicted nucleotidyltransferase
MPSKSDRENRTRADIDQVLKEIIDVLVREYQPETIILYGSYAYGNPTRHSDIDLCIIKDTPLNWAERFVQVKELIFKPGRNIPVQPNIYTPDEFEERLNMRDPFIKEIFTKGVRLYGRIARPAEITV